MKDLMCHHCDCDTFRITLDEKGANSRMEIFQFGLGEYLEFVCTQCGLVQTLDDMRPLPRGPYAA